MVTLLKVLNNHDDIYKYQRQFEAELSQASTMAAVKQISFRPQIRTRNIRWNLGLGIWWYLSGDNSDKVDENRWWNVFGVDDLDSTRSLRITCEINFPELYLNIDPKKLEAPSACIMSDNADGVSTDASSRKVVADSISVKSTAPSPIRSAPMVSIASDI